MYCLFGLYRYWLALCHALWWGFDCVVVALITLLGRICGLGVLRMLVLLCGFCVVALIVYFGFISVVGLLLCLFGYYLFVCLV